MAEVVFQWLTILIKYFLIRNSVVTAIIVRIVVVVVIV